MLYREIMAVCSEIHNINTQCGQKAESFTWWCIQGHRIVILSLVTSFHSKWTAVQNKLPHILLVPGG